MKTVIDLDVTLIETAAGILGTKTKKDTVHAALVAAIQAERKRQERHRLLVDSLGSPDLGDSDVMAQAWR